MCIVDIDSLSPPSFVLPALPFTFLFAARGLRLGVCFVFADCGGPAAASDDTSSAASMANDAESKFARAYSNADRVEKDEEEKEEEGTAEGGGGKVDEVKGGEG